MDFTKTIIPLALLAEDSEPIRARGIIVKYFYFLFQTAPTDKLTVV